MGRFVHEEQANRNHFTSQSDRLVVPSLDGVQGGRREMGVGTCAQRRRVWDRKLEEYCVGFERQVESTADLIELARSCGYEIVTRKAEYDMGFKIGLLAILRPA